MRSASDQFIRHSKQVRVLRDQSTDEQLNDGLGFSGSHLISAGWFLAWQSHALSPGPCNVLNMLEAQDHSLLMFHHTGRHMSEMSITEHNNPESLRT